MTLALLQLDAVVGVKGTFAGDELSAVGITCAVCHSTVDDAFAPGIGRRLDGWANQDLDVGAVIAFAPDLTPFTSLLGVDEETVRAVLQSWGPGKFDAQLALPAPAPPPGMFDPSLAAAGEALFNGPAQCATCHVPPLFTEPGYNMHTPEEIGIDDFQSSRSPDERYRTAPLKGLWTRTRGFYHDGRFGTLEEVVEHYDAHFELGLSDDDVQALKHYLLSR